MQGIFDAIGANLDSFLILVIAFVILFFVERNRRKSEKEADEQDALNERLESIRRTYDPRK